MQLDGFVERVAEDLRRAAAIGGEETARVADLLVPGIGATLRLHLIEALHAAARELESSAPGTAVDIHLDGSDPVLSLSLSSGNPSGDGPDDETGGDGLAGYADDELLRLTIRLPQGLKARVEEAAQATGASINSWTVAVLARALDAARGGWTQPGWPPPGRRIPRRMTGFVRG